MDVFTYGKYQKNLPRKLIQGSNLKELKLKMKNPRLNEFHQSNLLRLQREKYGDKDKSQRKKFQQLTWQNGHKQSITLRTIMQALQLLKKEELRGYSTHLHRPKVSQTRKKRKR